MTAQVIFYRLHLRQPNGKFRLACHIANKAFQNGHKVFVSLPDPERCKSLNDLLWTFSQNSFIPHTIYSVNSSIDIEKFPVVVSCVHPPVMFSDVLLSLLDHVPSYVTQFSRIVEAIEADSEDVNRAREKKQAYTSTYGMEPVTHFIKKHV